jgi:hypothetical protein
MAEGWRKLQNEELLSFYASQNFVRVIKMKENEMGGACSKHVRDWKCIQGNMKRRDHSKNLGADGKIMLQWILGK